ncbi:MAG: site-specific integrase [Planctomycetota bacterium]
MQRRREPWRKQGRTGWWATLYDEHGKRLKRKMSSDAEGRDVAVVRIAEYEQRVDLIRRGVVRPRDLEVTEGRQTPIAEALERFLASGRMQRRTAKYRDELRWWVESLASVRRLKRLGDITAQEVNRWLEDRADAGYAASSFARGRTRSPRS